MIVTTNGNTYKVSWKHYNIDRGIKVDEKDLKSCIGKVIKLHMTAIADRRMNTTFLTCLMDEVVKAVFVENNIYEQEWSECTIEVLDRSIPIGIIKGSAIVFPGTNDHYKKEDGVIVLKKGRKKDSFNRKVGVYESFKDAVSKISDYKIKKVLWREFLRSRTIKTKL